jgi:hypothetical protein
VLALLAACRGDTTEPIVLTLSLVGTLPNTVAGSPVGDSVRVRVVDANGAPHGGVTVTFAVTAGGGSVSPTVVQTNAQGFAATRFITGSSVGVNTITATVVGVAPVTASLTTFPAPAGSITIRERVVFIDVGQRFTPTITAVDPNGETVPLSRLTVTARTPGVVTLASDASVTGLALAQTVVVVSSSLAADSVLVVVMQPNSPVLQSDLARLDVARDTTFTIPIVLDMRTAPEKLGSTTILVRWDPAQFTLVSHVAGAAGSTGWTINDTGSAQGQFTLATVNLAGIAGRIEVRRLTFRATTTPGKTGTLRLSVNDISAAETFADLLPRTAAVAYPLSIR